MSSASITKVTSCLMDAVGSDNLKTSQNTGQDSFSQVFNQTNGEKSPEASDVKTMKAEGSSIQEHANSQKKTGCKSLEEKKQTAETMLEEDRIREVTEEIGAQMVEEVAKTFNVTVEEVEQAMEELGLIPTDLLNGENLTQLALSLNAETDSMAILTNEQLFTDLKGLIDTAGDLINQLTEEFSMTDEQLTQLLTAFKEEAVSQDEVNPQLLFADTAETQTAQEVVASATPEVEIEMENQPISVENLQPQDNQQVQENLIPADTVENQPEKSQSKPDTGTQEGNLAHTGESFASNLLNQLSEAVENASDTKIGYGVNGQELINQITEQIKILVKADTTEMELQLHPASLGSLKVQIASKAGILTATFTTENEAVKAAMEGQMVQLKENFEQQGLKVEAVEVNVEAKGFERSLDQQEKEQNDFSNQNKKGGRRISLMDLEGQEEELSGEELSEGDRIVADLMRRNGNTLDYTV